MHFLMQVRWIIFRYKENVGNFENIIILSRCAHGVHLLLYYVELFLNHQVYIRYAPQLCGKFIILHNNNNLHKILSKTF